MKRINEAIQKQGIDTWFDEERMSGDTRQQMVEGIENSDVIVVFITDAYRTKINQGDGRDNCRFEFKHAFEQKGPGVMIPVVMESGMRNARLDGTTGCCVIFSFVHRFLFCIHG